MHQNTRNSGSGNFSIPSQDAPSPARRFIPPVPKIRWHHAEARSHGEAQPSWSKLGALSFPSKAREGWEEESGQP